MEERLLGSLWCEAMRQEFQFGEEAFEGHVAVAYDTGYGWEVQVVPKYDVRIHINIADSTRYLSGEDRIHIVFSPFEEEIEIRDFILPLLETETYRERQESCCGGTR